MNVLDQLREFGEAEILAYVTVRTPDRKNFVNIDGVGVTPGRSQMYMAGKMLGLSVTTHVVRSWDRVKDIHTGWIRGHINDEQHSCPYCRPTICR